MPLRFSHPSDPGTVARLLNESYAQLLHDEPDPWLSEQASWEAFDQDVFENPETVGASTYVSWAEEQLVGLVSFDPRQRPDFGIVGHNCVLPAFRRQGFGKQQVREILQWFSMLGIRVARVSTCDHPFFVPAQRMYTSVGFREVGRDPWDPDPRKRLIRYELKIC